MHENRVEFQLKNWFGDKNYVYVDICIAFMNGSKHIMYKINNKWLYHFIDMHEIITQKKRDFLCMAYTQLGIYNSYIDGSNFQGQGYSFILCKVHIPLYNYLNKFG